jgi:hypothetical protein
MMNFMQVLIFSVPQFYKLFRNSLPGVLPTAHNPSPSNPTATLFTPRRNTDAEL